MDDLEVRVKAILDPDVSASASNINSKAGDIGGKIKPIEVPVTANGGELQKAVKKLNTDYPITLPVNIDTRGMDKRIGSVVDQIRNYTAEIEKAQGVIDKLTLREVEKDIDNGSKDQIKALEAKIAEAKLRRSEISGKQGKLSSVEKSEYKQLGVEIAEYVKQIKDLKAVEPETEKAYQAVIQYTTAIGETFTRTVEIMADSGEIITDTVDNMTVNFEKQRQANNNLVNDIGSYSSKLKQFKADYAEIINLEGNEKFKSSVEAIDFDNVTDIDSLNAMINSFKQAQEQAKLLQTELKNVRLDAKIRQDAQLYAQDLEKLKVQASTLLGGDGNDSFRKLIDSIDFSKIGNVDQLKEMVGRLKEAQKMLSTINAEFKGKDLASNAIEQLDKRFEKIRQSLRLMKLEIGDMELPSDMLHQLTEMENILKRQNSTSNPLGGEAKVSAYNDLQKLYDSFVNEYKYIQANNAALDEQIAKEQQLAEAEAKRKQMQEGQSHDYWQGQFEETVSQMTRVNDELLRMRQYYQQMAAEASKSATITEKEALQQQRALDKVNSLSARYQATGVRYSAFKTDPALRTEYEQLGNVIATLQSRLRTMKETGIWDKSIVGDIASANAQLGQFSNRVVAAGLNTKTLGDQFKNAIAKFGTWLSATSVLMKTVQKLKDAVTQVKEIDSAMVNLKKVTDETDESYQKFLQQTGDTAKQIGSTISDLVEATATFAKLGYSFGDAQKLAKVATIFANVGDFANIDTATNSLITAMKSFKLTADDAMGIADKVNEVANRYAISADGLAQGMTNSASALSLAGNTIDETIAMITAMSEITQDASESGNALKILSMRLRGAKADLASAGEETDGMCDSVSSLREKILALTGSVDIMADEAGTQFKSTYQIMSEIAQVWDNLTNINQAALLETIAGKMRGNSISALLTSMAQADNVLADSLHSAGSAMTEHERWLESIEAKEQQAQAAWQDFSDSLIDTGAVSGWYEALSDVLDVATKIVDTFGALPMLIGGITSALSAKSGLFGKSTNSKGDVIGTFGGSTWKDIVGAYKAVDANGNKGGLFGSLMQVVNGSVNDELIGQLKEIASSAGDAGLTMQALRDSITGVNGEMMPLNNATKQAITGITGGTDAMKALGISTELVTKKTLAQTIAINARNAALTMGIGLLVTAAITAATKWIPELVRNNSYEGQLETAQKNVEQSYQEYKDLEKQVEETNKELDATRQRMEELSGQDSLTFVEKEELENLKATNDELERQNEILKEKQDIQMGETRSNLQEEYAKEFGTRSINDGIDYSIFGASYHKITKEENIEKQIKLYSELNAKRIQGIALSEEEQEQLADAREYLVNQYDHLTTDYLDLYGNADDDFTRGIKSMQDNIYKALYPGKFKDQNFNEVIGLPQFEQAQKELVAKARDGSLQVDDLYDYEGLIESLSEVGISAEEATEQFNALYEAEVKANEASYSLYGLREQFAGTSSADSTLRELIGDQGYYASITEEQYNKLVEAGTEYADCVENENGFMQLNIEKANELVEAKYAEERATLEAGKAHAKEKYKDNTKEIAVQEKALELLEVQYGKNSDEYKNISVQILATIASLKSENEQIASDIAGYERLASEIEYATSAYKKWVDAQDAPNAGDAYDNLYTAMGQIQSGLDSGKIGTAQYKASVELLVPDGEEVQNYMKTLERYLTEDSTGLQNFIDDMFKRDNPFLSKNSDGTFSFMSGVSVEDIATGLGLTPEVTKYMLTALKDYGWDVDMLNGMFDEADGYKNYEAAQVSLADAQDRLNKLTESGVTSGEEYDKALQDVATAEEEVAKAGEEIGVVGEESEIEKLQKQLEEIRSAYATLADMKIGGDVDDTFLGDAEKVQSIIDVLSKRNTYSIGIETPEGLATKQTELEGIKTAIANLDLLFAEGKISEDLYLELSGNLKEDLTTVNKEIETYNKEQLLEKTANLNVVVKGAEEANKTINEIAEKERYAHIIPVVDEETSEHPLMGNEYDGDEYAIVGNVTPVKGINVNDGTTYTPKDIELEITDNSNEVEEKLEEITGKEYDANVVVKTTNDNGKEVFDGEANELIDESVNTQEHEVTIVPVVDTTKLGEEFDGDDTSFDLDVGADTSQAMQDVNTAKEEINDTEATIKVRGKYIGTTGIPMMAKGTKKAKDEDAIVGEAGVETWIHGDSFTTVGQNGAELVHLNRGDQILNADETKKLFGNKRASGRAFANGTTTLSKVLGVAALAVDGIKGIVSRIGTNVSGGGNAVIGGNNNRNGNGGGGGKTTKSVKEILDNLKDLVDWIPEALENAKEKTDEFIREADRSVSYMGKNTNLNKALASIDNEIDLNNQAFARYMKQADDTASMLNLSADIVQKIREGTIDIQSYDEETRSAISEYQKWFDKAEGAKQNIITLNDQVKTLSKQKLDNIINQFDDVGAILNSHIDLYKQLIDEKKQYGREITAEEYAEIVDDLGVTVNTLTEERQQLQDELNSLVSSGAVMVGDETWNEYSEKLITLSSSISEARTSLGEMNDTISNIPLERLNVVSKTIDQLQNTLDGIVNLRNAQGKEITTDLYEDMISATQAQIDNLEKQNQLLTQQLKGLDPLSEKYQEINDQIVENNNEILSAKASQEEWNDSIVDSQISALQKQNDEMKDQISLMDAIENLEKAKQRRALIYREGKGFNYEAIESDVREAQKALDDVTFDRQIKALEESKTSNNLYDDYGNELVPISNVVNGFDFTALQNSAITGMNELNKNTLASFNAQAVAGNTKAQENHITIANGAITLNGVNDVSAMADAIVNQLPGYITQELGR